VYIKYIDINNAQISVPIYNFGLRDEPRQMLKVIILKMTTGMFSETLTNFNIRRGPSPKTETAY
jgi:hypothetical protein